MYTAAEVEVFAVFCEELMTVYLVPLEDIPPSGVCSLRVRPVTSRQAIGIKFAADYEVCRLHARHATPMAPQQRYHEQTVPV